MRVESVGKDRLATVREAVGRDQRRERKRGKMNRTVREGDMKRSIDTDICRYMGIHICLYYKLRTGNLLSEISRKSQRL